MNLQIHLGLGDAIIMAPYIAILSTHEEVVIPAYEHNLESVKSFFVNHPNVKIIPNDTDVEWDISLGSYGDLKQNKGENFIDWFYRGLGKSREHYLPHCPLLEASKKVEQPSVPSDYIFVHDDVSRGFEITKIDTDLDIIKSVKDGSILRYANLIKNAKDIHVIDSAFFHLCEVLPTTGKLFYHQYARPYSTDNYKFIKDWEVIY